MEIVETETLEWSYVPKYLSVREDIELYLFQGKIIQGENVMSNKIFFALNMQ